MPTIRRVAALAAALLLLAAAGCATSRAAAERPAGAARPAARPAAPPAPAAGASGTTTAAAVDAAAELPTLIPAAELRAGGFATVYDLVRSRRPRWLDRAGERGLVVYLDHARFGGAESLRQLAPGSVTAVRYYSPAGALAHFGPGHEGGVIQVSTAP